jgi:poly [ADP-ribose] polymerase
LIDNNEILRKEVSMLDTLTDMEVANTIMKTTGDKDKDAESVNLLDKRFQELKMEEMSPLDHKSNEYKALADYLIKSSGTSHGIRYRLEDIFRIKRVGESERFAKSEFAKLKEKDKRLLWHGSRTTNYGGILSQGLRIAPPEAPLNGYAFGKGVYMADISSKSAQYCMAGMSGGTGLLLLCEAELGKPMYEIPSGDSNAQEQAKKHNAISTLGVGRTAPLGWVDGASIHESLEGVSVVS